MSSQNAADVQDVAEAERRLAEAHLSLDLEVIGSLLHRDYQIVQPGGETETKAQVLASYASGDRHWETAQVDELDVRLFGATAVVTGRWQASGQNGGEHFDYAAQFLSVWIKEDGRWQNVAYQAVEIEG